MTPADWPCTTTVVDEKISSHYDLATLAQCDEVEGGLAEIDPDRLNLHGDDPPSGFLPTTIISLVGLLDGGPYHYRLPPNNIV